MKQVFNIIISGVGGQGLITLLKVLAGACFEAGFDVKTSELHGLSQRGGSVSVHLRFGKEVFSPVVAKRTGDLMIALEMQEALSMAEYSKKDSIFLINKYKTATLSDSLSEKQIQNSLEKIQRKHYFIEASNICQKELKSDIFCGMFLLGYAISKGFLPLQEQYLVSSIKKMMSEKHVESNLGALELAKKYGK